MTRMKKRRSSTTEKPGVVLRYPLLVRIGTMVVCAVFGVAILRGPSSALTILAAIGSLGIMVAVLSYRAEINTTEVRVRYLPFWISSTPIGEITRAVQERSTTVVLLGQSVKISLWGISARKREALSRVLPARLYAVGSRMPTAAQATAVVRRHVMRTIYLAAAFLLTLTFSVPFVNDNRWHAYADSVGRYVMLACLILLMLFLLQGTAAWALWSYKRKMDKIDDSLSRHERQYHEQS
jgi:hypothetical protein